LETGPMVCTETSVRKYHSTLRAIQQEDLNFENDQVLTSFIDNSTDLLHP
jgi:hypothetical protein